jgi:hypothetical protein
VDVNIHAKGSRKAQISLQHTRLTSARSAEQMKIYWRSALVRLTERLSPRSR